MPEAIRTEDLLTAESLAAIDEVGPADLLVGIPALNQARRVVPVLEAVASGLVKHFSARRATLLVADAGSQDGTPEAVRAWKDAAPRVPIVQCLQLIGPPFRGRAILAILAAARRLGAQACGLFDADLASLTPDALERLLQPVVREEADFVSPAYTRTVSEGTLTTNLLAPMTRALYGKRIQQLWGGCAALSGKLVGRYLTAGIWQDELIAHGPEIWLPTEALASGARVVEAHLGRKKVEPGPAQPDLATTLVRVVGPLFGLMDRYRTAWQDARGSTPVPHVGDPPGIVAEASGLPVERMVRAFRLGLKDLLPVWEQIMPEETLARLYPLGLLAADEFQFPVPVWARVVSDFAVAYHERRLARDHLLRAMTPLYLGRVAGFLREVQAAPSGRIPEIMETIGRAFEAEKERLVARWR